MNLSGDQPAIGYDSSPKSLSTSASHASSPFYRYLHQGLYNPGRRDLALNEFNLLYLVDPPVGAHISLAKFSEANLSCILL